MKTFSFPRNVCAVFVAIAIIITFASPASAADHKYQATGPVLAVTDTSITIQKSDGPWTVSRDASTAVTGDLKVGSKVTIKYHMVADTVSVK